MAGGSHPEPVQARRRSIEADDRGREPTGCAGLRWGSRDDPATGDKLAQLGCLGFRQRIGAIGLPHGLRQSIKPRPRRRHDGAPAFLHEHLFCPCRGRFGRERSRLGKRCFPIDSRGGAMRPSRCSETKAVSIDFQEPRGANLGALLVLRPQSACLVIASSRDLLSRATRHVASAAAGCQTEGTLQHLSMLF